MSVFVDKIGSYILISIISLSLLALDSLTQILFVLIIDVFTLQGQRVEELRGHKLNQEAPWEFASTQQDADKVLVRVQWPALYHSSSVLHHEELHGDRHDHYSQERNVGQHAAEYIPFFRLKLPGIDLVENLHEYERVEDEREKLGLLSVHSLRRVSLLAIVSILGWSDFQPLGLEEFHHNLLVLLL